ncbi:MAG: hypothetical protein HY904_16635 [Deltaproteobacteria bacterium]|nr:hypothetical protein [Deltaproteobacteria bacterium]
MSKRFLGFLGATLALALVAVAVTATTGNYGIPPRLIGYEGMLEDNGVPINGSVAMNFRMFDAATGGTELWAETHDGADARAPLVEVRAGRFGVALGARTTLAATVFTYPEVYLAVEVAPAAGAPYVPLAGRQRLMSAPSSLVTARAKDLAAETASFSGDVSINGGNAAFSWRAAEGQVLQLAGANGTVMYLENLNGTFRLVNHPWTAGVFHVDQSGNVSATGTVTATGFLGATLDCYTTGWGSFTGCTAYPDPAPPACNAGYVFTGIGAFTQSDSGCGVSANTNARVKARCCRVQ